MSALVRGESSVSVLEGAQPSLRRFPYPYRAGFAICSDIDETQTTAEFLDIQRFLNIKDRKRMGEGVGLEIGNSFYFYDIPGAFSYFTHDEQAQRVIIDLIQAGYIDCLHTYGDGAASRDDILRALEVLYHAECKLTVWINHYGARSNFCRKFEYMFGECQGDDLGSNVYHADITLDYGIRFVWVGATTRMVGQSSADAASSLGTVFDARYPLRSPLSVLKEIRKNALGRWGDERYIMQWQNQLMRPLQLADGQHVHEFRRYCNRPVNIDRGATSRGLAYAISPWVLEHLRNRQGFMIVYTHFGKNHDCQDAIAPETQVALRHLEHEYRTGQIYVTTTAKLLRYYQAHQYLVWSHEQTQGVTQLHLEHLDDPVFGTIVPTMEQLQGLTFYVPDRHKTEVDIQGVPVQGLQRNPADDGGMESVTLPLTSLCFPSESL